MRYFCRRKSWNHPRHSSINRQHISLVLWLLANDENPEIVTFGKLVCNDASVSIRGLGSGLHDAGAMGTRNRTMSVSVQLEKSGLQTSKNQNLSLEKLV